MDNPNKTYIVQIVMSSPNHILETQEIDDITSETTYKFKKETRQKIAAIRQRHKRPMYENTLDFYGLHLCGKSQVKSINDAVEQADKELRELDGILGADVVFVPLDITEIRKGELYEQVFTVIKYRILSDVIERLEEKSGQLPKNSQKAIIAMLSRLRAVNVLGDADIEKRLTEIQDKILNQDLGTVRKELESELTQLTSLRGAFLEIKPQAQAKQHCTDNDRPYQKSSRDAQTHPRSVG